MDLFKEKYQPLQENGDEDEHNVSIPKKSRSSLVTIFFIASLCLNGLMGLYIALLFKEEGESLTKFGKSIIFSDRRGNIKGKQSNSRSSWPCARPKCCISHE